MEFIMKYCLQIGLALMALMILNSCKSGSDTVPLAEQGVYFKNLKDGDVVSSPVKVKMGIKGMEVEPAGKINAGKGHHHIIVNGLSLPSGKVVPADKQHIHFGKGQTEAELELKPGSYRLTLQFADGAHRSYGAKWSKTIQIKVK